MYTCIKKALANASKVALNHETVFFFGNRHNFFEMIEKIKSTRS